MLKKLISLPLFCAFLAACDSDTSNPAPKSPGERPSSEIGTIQGALSFIIVSDTTGAPVEGAQVMIGTAPNQPFANNIVTTDKTGAFKPMRDWNTAQPVTISANGFVRTTYMGQLPLQKSFVIRAKSPAVKPELNGITTGFGTLVKDGFVDVGVVIPALTRADIANFQASALLSPENDVITVAGQKSYLPSNITLPEQTESIFPITIKFNKPTYRMFFDRLASYKVVSAHVKFPLKKVLNETQDGKSGIDLVNHFTFLSAGINDTVIGGNKQNRNLAVNQIPFNSTFAAKAPVIGKTQIVLAVSLVKNGTHLYPTDMKNLLSKEALKLNVPANSSGFLLGVLREQTTLTTGAVIDFMSVNLKESSATQSFEFLPMIEAPKVANGILILRPPASLEGLKSVATTATLSVVEVKTVGKKSYEIKKPEWDVYAPQWVTEIALPTMPLELESAVRPETQQLRWESAFMAAPQATSPSALGPEMMNSVTHLTRSAVDL